MLVEVTELKYSPACPKDYDPEQYGCVQEDNSSLLNLSVVFKAEKVLVKLRKKCKVTLEGVTKVTSVTGQQMFILEDLSQLQIKE